VNLKGMKLLKCKTSINKILFSVKFFFATMFVIFFINKKNKKIDFFKIKFSGI
jgi:hypothetical protein